VNVDPKKGAWTMCANLFNNTDDSLLPDNAELPIGKRMLFAIEKEVESILDEDENSAERMQKKFEDMKHDLAKRKRQVLEKQKALQDEKANDLQKKAKLLDEVSQLQEKNKDLNRKVARFGQFLSTESAKLGDAAAAKPVAGAVVAVSSNSTAESTKSEDDSKDDSGDDDKDDSSDDSKDDN